MTLPADSSEPVVHLTDYTVRYGTVTAVDGVSFTMPRGASGLLGKNGAGKTSILKAVLGLIRPAAGAAAVLGLDTASDGLRLRDRIGYMPEKEAALPGLTGLEMVILAGQLSGLPAGTARQRAHEVLWLVGLDEPRYRPVDTYSLGMKQKAKLASALVHDPELLFLDEPTNGLDPEGRREILALLADLVRKKGKSLILSSHILGDVESLCEHVVLIDAGRVIGQGPVAELTKATGRFYELRSRGGDGRVEHELKRRGLWHRTRKLDVFEVFLELDQPTDVVFQAVLTAGGQVRGLVPQRKSLSDVFLDAVNREAVAELTSGIAPEATG